MSGRKYASNRRVEEHSLSWKIRSLPLLTYEWVYTFFKIEEFQLVEKQTSELVVFYEINSPTSWIVCPFHFP